MNIVSISMRHVKMEEDELVSMKKIVLVEEDVMKSLSWCILVLLWLYYNIFMHMGQDSLIHYLLLMDKIGQILTLISIDYPVS